MLFESGNGASVEHLILVTNLRGRREDRNDVTSSERLTDNEYFVDGLTNTPTAWHQTSSGSPTEFLGGTTMAFANARRRAPPVSGCDNHNK